MATILSITIDDKIATSCPNRLAERAEIAWATAWVAHQLQASPDLTSGIVHRDGTIVGSYEYTPVADT
jgi:hypothetical protein